ncbi:T5orf172 domain-containing protein [Belliella baltica DSM 15883]|uniref:T5orf172 domain-containing protein n=1 Tax=Belliella baltica (strain DSM 15883 / CIP 108006 / LMG 21964 / BA134) TaxID=866536 RepID=I3Z8S9_BELBD|nr:GIY-YIG nuclease family protein [Belliella baltica]AFL85647.1 T5orf172 domain-containing protein [Belliella baltica DSM 15883]
MSSKFNINDVFNDPEFNSIEYNKKTSLVKTDKERLIDKFEEINIFIDKNGREPSRSSMSEYQLVGTLKNFRENEEQKQILKPYDRHNLLGHVKITKPSIEDIFDDKDFKELNESSDLDIFKFNHTPRPEERAEADFVAQRKPLKEKEFEKYELMFQKVHKEIKEGKRKILPFTNIEKNLHVGDFYIMDGILLYLESANLKKEEWEQKSGNRVRVEGRTRTIFENGTYSNMLYRSLGKQIQKNGKLITNTYEKIEQDLFVNTGLVKEEDIQSGWIYVLKSKSTNSQIVNIQDLYKVGFASNSVDERIKNAKHEATYLFADVQKVATYKVYNRNADKLESLLHRFFANACLDIDLFNEKGQRLNPREWFVVPFDIIEETIQLILNENIVHYEYDPLTKKIKLK